MAVLQTKKGDCETCTRTDVDITLRYSNMWMCNECWSKEQALQATHMSPENQQKRLNEYLEKSRQIDQSINVKTDLFNAATIPAVELKASIDADSSIPADQKHFKYTEESYARFIQFKKAVFEKRQDLLETENAMRMWQTTVRTSAATLSAELREKFKELDLNYTPSTPKTPKPAAPKTRKGFSKDDLIAASKKYDIPMAAVQLVATAKNLTPEQSARHQRLRQDGKECDCPACMKQAVKS